MKVRTIVGACVLYAVAAGAGVLIKAQAPAAPPGVPSAAAALGAPPTPVTPQPAAQGGPGRGRQAGPPEAYPQRPPADPVVLERGKMLYSVNCAFCHGVDARGGDGGGPNLLRSQLVLSDQHGELIAEVVQNGRPGTTMLPLKLTTEQIADIATYIHSFRVGGYDITRVPPPSIVVGDAKAGEAAFQAKCSSCHSITGDLEDFRLSRIGEERDLQQMWLMPSAAGGRGRGGPTNVPPMTVAVTLPSGEKVEGRLVRIDDFIVALEQADGRARSFGRNGDVPKVEIRDPLKPHRDLLSTYTDEEIHNITAYLVTLK